MCQWQLFHFATEGTHRKKLLEAIKMKCPQGKEKLKPFLVSRKRINIEKEQKLR